MVYSKLTPIDLAGLEKGVGLASRLSVLLNDHYRFRGVHIDTAYLPLDTQRVENTVDVLIAAGVTINELTYLPELAKDAWGAADDPLFARSLCEEDVDFLRISRKLFMLRLGHLLITNGMRTIHDVRAMQETAELDFEDQLRRGARDHAARRSENETNDEHISIVRNNARKIVAETPHDQVIAFVASGAELRFIIDEFRNPGKQSPPRQFLKREIPLEWGEGYEIRLRQGRLSEMTQITPDQVSTAVIEPIERAAGIW